MRIISLTTDFGLKDESVGVMKGVIYSINPNCKIIDVCHNVEKFNIGEGAWLMENALRFLPVGIHIGVVDPGVGTERKSVIIKVKRGDYLVGPDNGLLIPSSKALGGITSAFEIRNEKYMLKPVSSSFHGRDIFSPVGAWLSLGVLPQEIGSEIDPKSLIKCPIQEPILRESEAIGNVFHVDNFGNLFTTIPIGYLAGKGVRVGSEVLIETKNGVFRAKYVNTFADAEKGEIIVKDNAYGNLQIAVNLGSAREKLNLKSGDKVKLSF